MRTHSFQRLENKFRGSQPQHSFMPFHELHTVSTKGYFLHAKPKRELELSRNLTTFNSWKEQRGIKFSKKEHGVIGSTKPLIFNSSTGYHSWWGFSFWEEVLWTQRTERMHTPTASTLIESSHRLMGQILRTICDREQPQTSAKLDQVVKAALVCTMCAMQCTSSTSFNGVAPGALVFGHHMLLNIPIVTDIVSIAENRQLETNLQLKRKNR